MKRRILILWLCFLTLCLGNCAITGPRVVRMSSQQIEQKLNSVISPAITVLRYYRLQLSSPVVAMDAVNQRVKVAFITQLNGPLLAEAVNGHLEVSGQLAYDAARSAVLFQSPRIEQVQFDGLAEAWQQKLSDYARQHGQTWLKEMVLHQVKSEQLTVAGQRYTPGDIRVTESGIELTLTPETR